MSQKSWPWSNTGTGDGTSGGYTALEWGEMFRQLFLGGSESTDSVLRGVGSELAVSGTASPLAVGSGAAVVYGKFYYNDASVNLAVTTPVVGTTGGHVILELDWVAQTVRLVVVRNTDGVNSTPSLTQNTSTKWQVRLASFTITTGGVITVTDARGFAHFSGKVKTGMFETSAVDGSTLEVAGGALRVKDLGIVTAKLADNSVTSAKIVDGTIATADLANDAVDDTKVGNRVPQFYRRQGGSSTDWTAQGTTTYTPGAVRMQSGVVDVSVGNGSTSGGVDVTFPVAFSAKPQFFLTADENGITGGGYNYEINGRVTTTQIHINVNRWGRSDSDNFKVRVHWLVIGAE